MKDQVTLTQNPDGSWKLMVADQDLSAIATTCRIEIDGRDDLRLAKVEVGMLVSRIEFDGTADVMVGKVVIGPEEPADG